MGETLEGISEKVRNVVKDAILNSDDNNGGERPPGIVILGNNNVVGDGNVVLAGQCASELSEQQRYLLERLPGLDEELLRELCRRVAEA